MTLSVSAAAKLLRNFAQGVAWLNRVMLPGDEATGFKLSKASSSARLSLGPRSAAEIADAWPISDNLD